MSWSPGAERFTEPVEEGALGDGVRRVVGGWRGVGALSGIGLETLTPGTLPFGSMMNAVEFLELDRTFEELGFLLPRGNHDRRKILTQK